MSEQAIKIAILMSTYNGEHYLREQLDSLEKQDIPVDIFIRDDGSSGKTPAILKEYESKSNIYVEYGSNLGYKKSFMTLLMNTSGYDYYAFCDQDDVWLPCKISSAIHLLNAYDDKPALYYSNLRKCNSSLEVYKVTDLDKRVMSLQSNILRRSIAGCTMVINKTLRQIAAGIGINDKLLLQGHDSYLVSLCYAVNGKTICDKNSYILYRQHDDNTSGSTNGILKRIKKEYYGLRKSSLNEYTIALTMTECCKSVIPASQLAELYEFISYKQHFTSRLRLIFSAKYSTGSFVLTLLGKIKLLLGIL